MLVSYVSLMLRRDPENRKGQTWVAPEAKQKRRGSIMAAPKLVTLCGASSLFTVRTQCRRLLEKEWVRSMNVVSDEIDFAGLYFPNLTE